jgi:BirA family biotin operon repressor/biotin-[acetyl-CoA-carboxylase] ligase
MNTLFVGQSTIHLATVDSTNSYASGILRQNSPADGTLVYTFDQQKGRGQRDSSWESEPQSNAALSLIMQPRFLSASSQFLLSIVTSLAMADLMAELLPLRADVCIKWPNDIYIGSGKIAGILIENFLREHQIQHSIIGVGININQIRFSFHKAVSLRMITGEEFDKMKVLQSFCSHFEARYLQLKAGKEDELTTIYHAKMYRLNEWLPYSVAGKVQEGKILGTSREGYLRLQLRDTSVLELGMKEVAFI